MLEITHSAPQFKILPWTSAGFLSGMGEAIQDKQAKL